MKKLLFIVLAVFIASSGFAQNSEGEEIDYIQSIYGMKKKNIVSEFLKLDESQQTAFWPIYDEYESKRKALGKKRIELLGEFEKHNESMTEEKADEWMKEVIKLGNANEKLLGTYYKKVKKAVGGIKAAQFYQIEAYLLTAQRFGIQDSLPVVGGQLN